ncbi:hypothetical protein F4777DRAFT_584691 [Nemania sp. FL0916]|nr:hypothetical protein F4777DRAFT_584691 [Nemania sp. FL0916]
MDQSKKYVRLLGNSDGRGKDFGRESLNAVPDIRSPLDSTSILPSLWDRASDALRRDNPQLVEKYKKLLSEEAHETSYASESVPYNQVMSEKDMYCGTIACSRKEQLEAYITRGLRRAEENKIRYTLGGKERVLTDQLQRAANFITLIQDWIGVAVRQSPAASIAWAGVCTILPLLLNPAAANKENLDGLTIVTRRMHYYAQLDPMIQGLHQNSKISQQLITEVDGSVVTLYQKFLEFQIQTVLRLFKESRKRYFGDVLRIEDWKQMILDIEKLDDSVRTNLSQITQIASQRELESLDKEIEHLVPITEEHLRVSTRQLEIQENEVENRLNDKEKACLHLFRLTDSNRDVTYEWYKGRVENRLNGTCEWFLNHENYRNWNECDSGPLLVSADPGCGKSVLAKYLIDHELPRSSMTICYFFFKDQDQNTVRQALCALLHQLFLSRPVLLEYALTKYNQEGSGLTHSTTSLWTLLETALRDSRAGPVTIVLDALDECAKPEFESLIKHIERQFSASQPSPKNLKYLLTSRPYEQIVSKFQQFLGAFPSIHIPGEKESDTISKEINHVIEYRVEKLGKEKRLPRDVKDHLAKILLQIPHRTYLWIYLVFDYLEKEGFKKTKKGVDFTITLPTSVYQAYERILDKSKDHPMVRKALSIIITATRPLTIMEMNVALNIDDTTKTISDLDLEAEEDFESRLRDWCGLFISIHHRKVYLLHQTAREFLQRGSFATQIPIGGRWQHSISTSDGHKILAEVCITYLDFFNFIDDSQREQDSSMSTFLRYAALNWASHLREADFTNDAWILLPASRICDPDMKGFLFWFSLYNDVDLGINKFPDGFNSLSTASLLGLEKIVKLLLSKDPHGETQLYWAVMRGHEAVVRVYLDYGADLNVRDPESGWTALHWAAIDKSYSEMTRLLLMGGADPNMKDESGKTPLMIAATENNVVAVTLLIDGGANIEERDQGGNTALIVAAEWRNNNVVKVLLEKGADINTKNNNGETAIRSAWDPETERLILSFNKE